MQMLYQVKMNCLYHLHSRGLYYKHYKYVTDEKLTNVAIS